MTTNRASPLQVGDQVPDFTCRLATATEIKDFRFSQALRQGPVVIVWFPLAFTGVCTAELCEVRDTLSQFNALHATVYGASIDTPQTNRAFIQKEHLTFPILSDPNREVVGKFGIVADQVAGVKHVSKRSVFVADASGRVIHAWVSDDPERRPDFEAVRAAIKTAAP